MQGHIATSGTVLAFLVSRVSMDRKGLNCPPISIFAVEHFPLSFWIACETELFLAGRELSFLPVKID